MFARNRKLCRPQRSAAAQLRREKHKRLLEIWGSEAPQWRRLRWLRRQYRCAGPLSSLQGPLFRAAERDPLNVLSSITLLSESSMRRLSGDPGAQLR